MLDMKTKYPSSLAIMFCSYQLACGQAPADTATPPSAVSTNQSVVFKNPSVLQDGKLIELKGQWLYMQDGRPVFVQTEPIQTPASNAPQGGRGGQPFVLLGPVGGSAYSVQYQYFVSGAESVCHYYPYYYRGYYRSSVYGGYSGYYRPHHSSGGGARYGYRSDGALVLIPSHGSSGYGGYGRSYRAHRHSGGGARYGYRSDGARVLIPSHRR